MVDGSAAVPQANPNGLMHIGAVAAHNIVAALELPETAVGKVEQAIKDEINAMSSHFTLAIADVQTQYEVEVKKLAQEKDDFIAATKARETAAIKAFEAKVTEIKSVFNFVEANRAKLIGIAVVLVLAGVLVGKLI